MFAHQVKIEGTHYPALTFLVDNLRNEGFAPPSLSTEAELFSPRSKLSTRIIPRKISQGNQLGAAHLTGFLSLGSLHSSI